MKKVVVLLSALSAFFTLPGSMQAADTSKAPAAPEQDKLSLVQQFYGVPKTLLGTGLFGLGTWGSIKLKKALNAKNTAIKSLQTDLTDTKNKIVALAAAMDEYAAAHQETEPNEKIVNDLEKEMLALMAQQKALQSSLKKAKTSRNLLRAGMGGSVLSAIVGGAMGIKGGFELRDNYWNRKIKLSPIYQRNTTNIIGHTLEAKPETKKAIAASSKFALEPKDKLLSEHAAKAKSSNKFKRKNTERIDATIGCSREVLRQLVASLQPAQNSAAGKAVAATASSSDPISNENTLAFLEYLHSNKNSLPSSIPTQLRSLLDNTALAEWIVTLKNPQLQGPFETIRNYEKIPKSLGLREKGLNTTEQDLLALRARLTVRRDALESRKQALAQSKHVSQESTSTSIQNDQADMPSAEQQDILAVEKKLQEDERTLAQLEADQRDRKTQWEHDKQALPQQLKKLQDLDALVKRAGLKDQKMLTGNARIAISHKLAKQWRSFASPIQGAFKVKHNSAFKASGLRSDPLRKFLYTTGLSYQSPSKTDTTQADTIEQALAQEELRAAKTKK